MIQWVFVFIGGGLGSMARFACTKYIDTLIIGTSTIPLPTLIANILSCFVLGILINKYVHSGVSPDMRLLLATGFCGGFSTFSTLSLEMFNMIERGQPGLAFSYIAISTLLGLAALFTGYKIGF